MLWGLLPLWVPAFPASAEESTDPPQVQVVRIEEPPVLDGRLDDEVWSRAVVVRDFIQVEPVEGASPLRRSEILILSDLDHLYFGVRFFDDDPETIIAQKMLRDTDVNSDDRFSFVLDTFHDSRNGYLFQISALGTRRDALIEGNQVTFDWDGIWNAKAEITDEGWTAEVVIPYRTLSFDPEKDRWGLNLLRGVRGRVELLRWADAYQDTSFINMANAGHLDGMKGVRQGVGLDIVPSVTGRYIDDGPKDDTTLELQPSLDVFYKLTPSLTGVLTFNTDFGEAEVDERQVNLTRFNLFFPERRDFFLQDAGIFEFGNLTENGRTFFSRRIGIASDGDIVDLIAGAKVTGRVQGVNIGALSVQTNDFALNEDNDDLPTERIGSKNLGVARVAVNVLENSKVGLIGTWGDPDSDDYNYVLGTDFMYSTNRFLGDKVLRGRLWYQHSETEGLGDAEDAYGASLVYPNDRINWNLTALEIQRNFNPALGFVNRAGIRDYAAQFRYRHRRSGFIRTIDHLVTSRLVTGSTNDVQTGELVLTLLDIATLYDDGIEIAYEFRHESLLEDFDLLGIAIPEDRYDAHRIKAVFDVGPGRQLSGQLQASWGGFFSGDRLEVLPTIAWRPSRHWLFQLQYVYNDITTPQGDTTTHLARGRVNFQLTPDLSWNTLVQYENVTDNMGINSRLRWIIVPGRELIIVFNQGFLIEDGRPERGITEPLVKLRWTFRY